MKLETALDEFGVAQRRRHRGEEGRLVSLSLDALREYLLDYASRGQTEALTPEDFLSFVLEYYPSQEEPHPEVAMALLEISRAFGEWLIERDERAVAPFIASADRLRDDLPRVMEAMAVLQEHARRDDLVSPIPVSVEEQENSDGALSGGLDRLVRLDQVDYTAAQLDYFTVERIAPEALALRSSSRDVLQEGLAEPVRVPARAAELLQPGDVIYAEIAPVPDGWELLEIFGLRPGGYA